MKTDHDSARIRKLSEQERENAEVSTFLWTFLFRTKKNSVRKSTAKITLIDTQQDIRRQKFMSRENQFCLSGVAAPSDQHKDLSMTEQDLPNCGKVLPNPWSQVGETPPPSTPKTLAKPALRGSASAGPPVEVYHSNVMHNTGSLRRTLLCKNFFENKKATPKKRVVHRNVRS